MWSERIQGRLKPWHLTFDVRSLTGMLAIILLLIHAIWAAVVLLSKDARLIAGAT